MAICRCTDGTSEREEVVDGTFENIERPYRGAGWPLSEEEVSWEKYSKKLGRGIIVEMPGYLKCVTTFTFL